MIFYFNHALFLRIDFNTAELFPMLWKKFQLVYWDAVELNIPLPFEEFPWLLLQAEGCGWGWKLPVGLCLVILPLSFALLVGVAHWEQAEEKLQDGE